jgi:Tfp pilus assembly protein PilN
MLTWAFAIPLDMPIANQQGIQAVANLTSNFLSTLPVMLLLTLVPAALMGLVGALFVSKTITIPNFQNQQLQQQQQQQQQQHSSKFIFQEKGGTRKRIY